MPYNCNLVSISYAFRQLLRARRPIPTEEAYSIPLLGVHWMVHSFVTHDGGCGASTGNELKTEIKMKYQRRLGSTTVFIFFLFRNKNFL
jgi:hypothetical protein